MAITVACECGKTYRLKDELAGRRVECPACKNVLHVTAVVPTAQADPIFDRDRFLLRQKHLALSQKYYVWDEAGEVLLFIERPTHWLRSLGALFAAMLAGIVVIMIFGFLALALSSVAEWMAGVAISVGFVAMIAAILVVAVAIGPRRHVYFYRDDSRQEQVLQVLQDHKWIVFRATYTVLDREGDVLAVLQKNYLYNLLRRRWLCLAPTGELACMALEDSVILSLLRRVLGSFAGLLRVNFIIVAPDAKTVIGEFNRKPTLLDRYVLDLSRDPSRSLDRRVALALGVMLDTGERR